ncbi:CHASE2 domain-containing protein [Thiohalorhabdus sp. Cl-TMA]|uniref:CHASE2 domain-containing protein n=1 Tax=Thiohalorhabdus methylotrophus TaxID=3242694 RepID=A0ABV4TTY5_9GAMM
MIRGKLKAHYIPILLGAALVVLTLWAQQTNAPVVQDLRKRLEGVAYDLRFRVTLPFSTEKREPVAIVDIDEKSLDAEGRWPWPRDKVAQLVDRLFEAGAVVVGMDMVFAEPQRNLAATTARHLEQAPGVDPSAEVLATLSAAAPALDDDRALARALDGHDVVMGYMLSREGPKKGALGPPLPTAELQGPEGTSIQVMDHHLGNLPMLQEAAASGGFFSIFPDRDGILRRYHLILAHNDTLYPSLALEMARLYLLAERVRVVTAPVGEVQTVDHLDMGGLRIPTGGHGDVLVPYRGAAGSFPYISATDVLSGEVSADKLAGKLVLIGTTARGLYDLRATPVQSVYPGVEVHANVLRGLLNRSFPRSPAWAEGANFIFMLVMGLLLAVALPLLRPLTLSLLTGALGLALVAGNVLVWSQWHWVIPIALPLFLVLGLGTLNMAYGFLFAERGRRRLKDMFGQYVPPELVDEMTQDPESASSMEGERRDMTVLFADIRGFTAISEQLSAAELKDLLNRFFTPMTRVIFEHRGTIDKYVGDMIMAFWGAPLEDPEHARNGVKAALAMRGEAERLRFQFQKEGLPDVDIGVGLNSGAMNVGNMGSEYRRSYTVLGDAVNLGSRLEGLTKHYGASIVVSDVTREGLEDEILFRRLDRVQVKGRDEPLTIFEPLCPREEASAELLAEVDKLEQALSAYWRREWAEAEELFTELSRAKPDERLYELYLERIESIDPTRMPADWDGVYRHESK